MTAVTACAGTTVVAAAELSKPIDTGNGLLAASFGADGSWLSVGWADRADDGYGYLEHLARRESERPGGTMAQACSVSRDPASLHPLRPTRSLAAVFVTAGKLPTLAGTD